MIFLSDFMLSGQFLGNYTIPEIKKICKKSKKELRLSCPYNLSFLSSEEINSLYLKNCKIFHNQF